MAKAKIQAFDMSIRCRQMQRKSQSISGNWAIGQPVRPHAMVAFNSANQSVSKLSKMKWSMKSSVGRVLKMISRIRRYAFATMCIVRRIGGLVHGNCVQLHAKNMVISTIQKQFE